MELWTLIKERSLFLSIFLILVLLSVFLLVATWKNRSNIPKRLSLIITLVCTFFIVVSLFAMLFIISFGYNS